MDVLLHTPLIWQSGCHNKYNLVWQCGCIRATCHNKYNLVWQCGCICVIELIHSRCRIWTHCTCECNETQFSQASVGMLLGGRFCLYFTPRWAQQQRIGVRYVERSHNRHNRICRDNRYFVCACVWLLCRNEICLTFQCNTLIFFVTFLLNRNIQKLLQKTKYFYTK